MKNRELIDQIVEFVANSKGNYVSAEDTIYPELAGMKIYEEPLVGFARADDELFISEFKKNGVIHPEYLTPSEWLPSAKTVISFFLPFTKEVKESNRNKTDEPYEPDIPQTCSAQWLHARIEGQIFLNKVTGTRLLPCSKAERTAQEGLRSPACQRQHAQGVRLSPQTAAA